MADLKKGSTGKAVEKAQKNLNVYKAKLKVDGEVGPKTDAATRAFQKASLLKVDGIIGVQTQAAFNLPALKGALKATATSGGKGITLPQWPGADYMQEKAKRQILFISAEKKHAKMQTFFANARKEFEKAYKGATDANTKTFNKKFAEGGRALKQDFKALTGAFADLLNYTEMMIGLMVRYEELRQAGKVLDAAQMIDATAREQSKDADYVKAFNTETTKYDATYEACDKHLCDFLLLMTGKFVKRAVR